MSNCLSENILIKPYSDRELNAVLNVWEKASALAHPFLDDDFQKNERINLEHIYLKNAETWVSLRNNLVVGFISMIDNEIGGLFVLPEFHTQGIGKTLVDFVRKQHQTLFVEVFEKNDIGRRFYSKYGFEPILSYTHHETGNTLIRLKFE